MEVTKMTLKGQVTIPRQVRQELGLRPYDRVVFLVEGKLAFLLPIRKRSLMALYGSLPATRAFPGHARIRREIRRRRGEALERESAR